MVERVSVLAGAGLIVGGVAVWSWPGAMVLAGLLLLAGVFLRRPTR